MAKISRDEMDEQIRSLCLAKGYKFKLWEIHPAEVDDRPPHPTYPPGHGIHEQWPKAQKLRRQLIAEIEAGRRG